MLSTFGQVLEWIAPKTGKTVDDNRDALVREANRIIEHFYLSYERDGILEHPVEECIMAEKFRQDCHDCEPTYWGFVLPDTIQGLEGVRKNDTPLKLHGKWRAYHPDAAIACKCDVQVQAEMTRYPFEREFTPGYIKFLAKDKRDHGKKVRVVAIDSRGQEFKEDVCLASGYISTSREISSISEGGVALPDLKGSVTASVEDAEGCARVLARYAPHERVPSYRRYRVDGLCESDCLRIVGTRRNIPLYFDTDVVHLGNRLAFEEMALSFKYAHAEDSDPSVGGKAEYHETRARKYLIGEKARENGRGAITRINLHTGRIRRGGLNSNRR